MGSRPRSEYNSHQIKFHRFLTNAEKGQFVDHINHDPLDNRQSNLRICTFAENQRNKPKRKNTSSRYKGVAFHKRANKYIAQIAVDKKQIYLGLFEDEKEAAKAYNEAAIIHHKEFASLNII